MTASVFTGSFKGDGSGLTNIPAGSVSGLNLSQIATGSVSASLSLTGFNVNTNTSITGSLTVSGPIISATSTLISGSSQVVLTSVNGYTTFSSSLATTNATQDGRLTSLETSTSSLNTFTGSINTTIKTRLSAEGVISGSSQVTNIANSQLTNSSFHVGTTSISLGRTSASQTLTGVSIDGNASTASRVVSGNSNPASTSFNNTLTPAVSSNRVLNFDGNGNTPSVWWTNGSRAYGAIDAQDPGLTFWANNGTSWQQQANFTYGNFNINTTFSTSGQSTFGGSLTVNVATTPIVLQTSGANRGWIYSDGGGVGINQGGTTWRNLVYCTADYIRFHTAGGARWDVDASGHFVPVTNNAFNIGSTSNRVANLYTNDLHLSNEGRVDGNEIDGTTGDWTIQEGAENLYIINNKNGKKFKIDLTEIK
jgi:hypothetical protein